MIYLDHAAATPVSKKALAAMQPYFSEFFFNPSSPYLPAKRVREAYESAKDAIAHTIGAKGVDLIITSGATESANLAFTVCHHYPNSEIIICATEHASVLETAKAYSHQIIPVDHAGRINLAALQEAISDQTILVSVSMANNELGTTQPLAEISRILADIRADRAKRNINRPLYLHSDASQAVNLIDINVSRLGIDLLTLNAAKCGGPKGIGALYARRGIKLTPIIRGGGQEHNLRSGTENVPSVIGFATAIQEAKTHLTSSRRHYQKLTQLLRAELESIPNIIFLGNPKYQLANFLPICIPGLNAERIIYKLEQSNILISTGAACAASKGVRSHVLAAIGLNDQEIAGSLRISLGSTNTEANIRQAGPIIRATILEELNSARASKTRLVRSSSSPAAALPNSTNLSLPPNHPSVFLGMSGGVDSSVSAVLLKEQGYHVTGVYMKNWSKDLPGMKCPWAEDLADAERVATQLGIPFEVWDFEHDYKTAVVDYMLAEFQKGNTPNPDVICNELIKFKLFYERARARGANYIATGHYARIGNQSAIHTAKNTKPTIHTAKNCTSNQSAPSTIPLLSNQPTLLTAVDANKDQTYFLYRMSDEALSHTLFPIGNLTKPAVKELAATHHLDVATKKESMGICFVGEVGMKDFLEHYLKTAPGNIIDADTNQIIGHHDGAILYTIGQRHGLYLGGGLPYYVVGKDLPNNLVYVSRNLNHPNLWCKELSLTDFFLRNHLTIKDIASLPITVRLRHRGELIPAQLRNSKLIFDQPIKTVAPGQSAVFYHGDICLGGGIIA